MYWFALMVHTAGGHDMLARVGRRLRGQSTVEYALVGALIVIAAAIALTAMSTEITGVFNNISATLRSAARH
jgi:Flp pilus assembly pilin Flp